MFTPLAVSVFDFLVRDFGFEIRILAEKAVQFEKAGCFVRLFHSELDEVCLRVGIVGVNFDKGFDAASIVALDPSKKVNLKYEEIAIRPDHVERCLNDLAGILLSHGRRVLDADLTVFDEMKIQIEKQWADRGDDQIRRVAEKAFAEKNFAGALKYYRVLEGRRRPLDTKRMEICEKNLLGN